MLASLSRYGATLWDTVTWSEIHTFDITLRQVGNIAFSPDGKTIVMANDDPEVRLWDTGTGALLGSLTGHRSGISCAAFLPDGKTLISGSLDGTMLLWDTSAISSR